MCSLPACFRWFEDCSIQRSGQQPSFVTVCRFAGLTTAPGSFTICAVLHPFSLESPRICRNQVRVSAYRLDSTDLGAQGAGAHPAPCQGDPPLGRHGAHPSVRSAPRPNCRHDELSGPTIDSDATPSFLHSCCAALRPGSTTYRGQHEDYFCACALRSVTDHITHRLRRRQYCRRCCGHTRCGNAACTRTVAGRCLADAARAAGQATADRQQSV